jgi:predicted dinucleotide-utilizing enzyme
MVVEAAPSPDTPRTSRIAIASALALLERTSSQLQIGT